MTDVSTNSMPRKSLQEIYAPKNACFGCGPANTEGLRLRSFSDGDLFIAQWQPEKRYEAFSGGLCGGIIGTLLDCHSNWAAAIQLMGRRGQDFPPCTVTAEYTVKLLWPTPTNAPVQLVAHVIDSTEDRATVEATVRADGKVCASCRGIFVAVRAGHPAYHRW